MTRESDRRTALEKSVRIIRSRQETRERILQSTKALLDRKSAQDFQIRDVAREAGVSASLIIQYFTSKNDLVFETALRRLEAVNADLAARFEVAPPETLAVAMQAFFEADWPISHIIRDLMSLSWWWSPENEERVREVFQPRETAVRAALTASGLDPAPSRVDAAMDAYFATFRSGCVTGAARDDIVRMMLDRISLIA